MPELVVEAKDVWRTHHAGGQRPRAGRADLNIERGEFVAVMGPSGSGKSTLLNVLGCLDRPTSRHLSAGGGGHVELDADALARLRNRRIGFCFQSYNLLPRATAVQNVALPLVYSGVDQGTREARARARLIEVGLGRASSIARPSCPAGNSSASPLPGPW